MQRPGLNGLLEVTRAGEVLVVTALDRLGRDTLGLLELIHRLATMGVEMKVLEMAVDAQDVTGGGHPVALVTSGVVAIEGANISGRTNQGLERARAEGNLAGRRWSLSRARMHTRQRMRKDLGMSLAQIAQRQGVSQSLVRRVLGVEEVEALPASAFKDGWDWTGGEAGGKEARTLRPRAIAFGIPGPCHSHQSGNPERRAINYGKEIRTWSPLDSRFRGNCGWPCRGHV